MKFLENLIFSERNREHSLESSDLERWNIGDFRRVGLRPIQIFVKCHKGNTVVLNMDRSVTIAEVKESLIKKEGANCPVLFDLSYGGARLNDSKTIADYGLKDNYTLHIC